MLDYEFLKVAMWLIVGVMLAGFAIADGFDFGALALFGLFHEDSERRVILNSIGRFWDGNQVWLIAGGIYLFAAFPYVYASIVPLAYIPIWLLLSAFILRAIAFEYRSKSETVSRRNLWDYAFIFSGTFPPIAFGLLAGNAYLGFSFGFDQFLHPLNYESFIFLFTPFPILCGVIGLLMCVMHGAAWLRATTDEQLQHKAKLAVLVSSVLLVVLFTLAGVWTYFLPSYTITQIGDLGASLIPTNKLVALNQESGGWFANYGTYPWMIIAPVLAYAGALGTLYLNQKHHPAVALASGTSILGIILTLFFSLFPFIAPSSYDPNVSLTLWDATSSNFTLNNVFWIFIAFFPIVLAYTIWSYYKLWGRIHKADVTEASSNIVY